MKWDGYSLIHFAVTWSVCTLKGACLEPQRALVRCQRMREWNIFPSPRHFIWKHFTVALVLCPILPVGLLILSSQSRKEWGYQDANGGFIACYLAPTWLPKSRERFSHLYLEQGESSDHCIKSPVSIPLVESYPALKFRLSETLNLLDDLMAKFILYLFFFVLFISFSCATYISHMSFINFAETVSFCFSQILQDLQFHKLGV